MQIREVRFNNKSVHLSDENNNAVQNLFTVIIGKNGSGKSTLLQRICLLHISASLKNDNFHSGINDLIEYSERKALGEIDQSGSFSYYSGKKLISISSHTVYKLYSSVDLNSLPNDIRDTYIKNEILNNNYRREEVTSIQIDKMMVNNDDLNRKVIAVTSSPFDKFPILDQRGFRDSSREINKSYIYRGSRTQNERRNGYIKSKLDQLGASFINFFLRVGDRKSEINPLFNYLDLEGRFKIYLSFPDHFRLEDLTGENSRSPSEIINSVKFFKGKDRSEVSLSESESLRIIEIANILQNRLNLENPRNYARNQMFSFTFDINETSTLPENLAEISELTDYDLIDLVDIEFIKKKEKTPFLLTDASSGELCILFNVLSIAGAIADESIILIDEPELSLHPEWQRGFLPLLKSVFSHYKGCHFIITTHSPHLISALPDKNSYVVNLEDSPALTVSGSLVNSKSADYQLAQTFKSPGYENEYLISQALDILSLISEGKTLDKSLKTRINNLMQFYSLVSNNDPVKKLLSTLKKAVKVLSDDK